MTTVTKEQLDAAQSMGGGALVRKLKAVEDRINAGKAGGGELKERNKLVEKILQLAIKADETLAPAVATEAPQYGQSGMPKDEQQEKEWLDQIETRTQKLNDQYTKAEITEEEYKEKTQKVVRHITHPPQAKTQMQILQQIDNLKAFKKAGKFVPRMFSKKLGHDIAVISREEQRAKVEAGITVYTIEEAISLVQSGLEESTEDQKAIDAVKGMFDGEIIAVPDGNKKQLRKVA